MAPLWETGAELEVTAFSNKLNVQPRVTETTRLTPVPQSNPSESRQHLTALQVTHISFLLLFMNSWSCPYRTLAQVSIPFFTVTKKKNMKEGQCCRSTSGSSLLRLVWRNLDQRSAAAAAAGWRPCRVLMHHLSEPCSAPHDGWHAPVRRL